MKLCNRCNKHKEFSEFNKYHRGKNGLQPYCRECQKSHYRGNVTRHAANVAKVRKATKKRLREIARKVLEVGCVQCGITDLRVLDFDHLPEFEKKYNVADMIRSSMSEKALIAEIAKCEVVCRNHHAIRTAERLPGGTWRDLPH